MFIALFLAAVLCAGLSFALLLAARHALLGEGLLLAAYVALGLLPAGLMLVLAPSRATPGPGPGPAHPCPPRPAKARSGERGAED